MLPMGHRFGWTPSGVLRQWPVVLTVILWFTTAAAAPLSSGPEASSPSSDRELRIPRVQTAPTLQQYLSGVRPPAARVSEFRQRFPGDGAPVSEPTTAFLSYDDRNLYILFECHDDPRKLRAHLAKREDIADDDYVSVLLDTFHDQHRAYAFGVNPLNV